MISMAHRSHETDVSPVSCSRQMEHAKITPQETRVVSRDFIKRREGNWAELYYETFTPPRILLLEVEDEIVQVSYGSEER